MVSHSDTVGYHRHISGMGMGGAASCLIGSAMYAVSPANRVSLVMFTAGVVLITLAIAVFSDEKEDIATDVTGQLQQLKNKKSEPWLHESALVASLGAIMILSGLFMCRSQSCGELHGILFAVGWVTLALAGAMNSRASASVRSERLMWTLPGAVMIAAGTLSIPHSRVKWKDTSPSVAAAAIGYALFVTGVGRVTRV